ncbi:MAG: DUF4105 domain-containing protein [Bacteroidota bacterium]
MRKTIYLLFSCLSALVLRAQQIPQLSDQAQISVMTCGAGNELYSAFGHTAFRVQDSLLGLDIVYNYGTFDFDRPNFYLNFAKGKLIYSLSRTTFERFLFTYEYEKRWVKEQILDLTSEEVNLLFRFFENNYRPENRDYLYDPLFNNCSNIVAVIFQEQLGNGIQFNDDHLERQSTFRQLVREFLPTNSWGAFGIELAFGAVTDRTTEVPEQMFAPYYALYQLRHTTKNGDPIVKRERKILDYPEPSARGTFVTSPLFWFSLLFLFVLVITFLDKKHGTRHKWLDFTLFLVSGLAGTSILLLWLATDHVVTQGNFNFLWLLPSNAVVAFFLFGNSDNIPWLGRYLWIVLGGLGSILVLWIFKIQVLSPLNILLMLILVVRYLFLLKKI